MRSGHLVLAGVRAERNPSLATASPISYSLPRISLVTGAVAAFRKEKCSAIHRRAFRRSRLP
jgi:hypothetical protein